MKISFEQFEQQSRENQELAIELSPGEWVVFPGLFLMPREQRKTVAELSGVLSDNFFEDGNLREGVDEDEIMVALQGVLREACVTGNFEALEAKMPNAFLPWMELYIEWLKGIGLGEA